MNLLLFAHRGEAQEFIKNMNARALNDQNTLYQAEFQSEDWLIFLTGEGIYEVFTSLGPLLGKYPVKKALNYGIAGSLDSRLEPGAIFSVKTVYAFDKSPLFHSFPLNQWNRGNQGNCESEAPRLDLITASERALDDNTALALSRFAPAVDRELWAIAKLCSAQKIPLQSFKLVSDMAGADVDCFDLKQKALEFSTKLFELHLKLENQNGAPELTVENEPPMPMSFSQKAKYKKLMDCLARTLDTPDLERIAQEINTSNFSSKQKANKYLEELENLLNPAAKQTKIAFKKLSAGLNAIGAKLVFDQNFEKKKFTLQMEVNDQKNLNNLAQEVERLRFKDFEKIWDGDFDV